jgi:hypothetical protein
VWQNLNTISAHERASAVASPECLDRYIPDDLKGGTNFVGIFWPLLSGEFRSCLDEFQKKPDLGDDLRQEILRKCREDLEGNIRYWPTTAQVNFLENPEMRELMSTREDDNNSTQGPEGFATTGRDEADSAGITESSETKASVEEFRTLINSYLELMAPPTR